MIPLFVSDIICGPLQPGRWHVKTTEWDMVIFFMCPNGHIWRKDGYMNAAMHVDCKRAYPECDFDAMVRLKGYEED